MDNGFDFRCGSYYSRTPALEPEFCFVSVKRVSCDTNQLHTLGIKAASPNGLAAVYETEILVFRAGARHNRTSLIRIRNVNIGNSALIAGNSCIDILYIVLDHCF